MYVGYWYHDANNLLIKLSVPFFDTTVGPMLDLYRATAVGGDTYIVH